MRPFSTSRARAAPRAGARVAERLRARCATRHSSPCRSDRAVKNGREIAAIWPSRGLLEVAPSRWRPSSRRCRSPDRGVGPVGAAPARCGVRDDRRSRARGARRARGALGRLGLALPGSDRAAIFEVEPYRDAVSYSEETPSRTTYPRAGARGGADHARRSGGAAARAATGCARAPSMLKLSSRGRVAPGPRGYPFSRGAPPCASRATTER